MSNRLKQGDVGERVDQLHRWLRAAGHAIDPTEAEARHFGPNTREALLELQTRLGIAATGDLDEATIIAIAAHERAGRLSVTSVTFFRDEPHPHPPVVAPPPPTGGGDTPASATPVVSGTVLHANGGPLSGITVHAFDKMLRREVPLGEALSGAAGTYRIPYAATALSRPPGHPPDLLVRAYQADGTLAGESAVLFRAPAVATIDVILGGAVFRGYSDFEQIHQAMAPSLDQAAPGDLTDAEVQYVAQDAAVDAGKVIAFARASKLAGDLGVPAGIVYGLLRDGLPSDPATLAAVPARVLRAALTRALGGNVIPTALSTQVEGALTALGKYAVSSALGSATATALGSLGPILATAGVSRAVQEQVLTAFLDVDKPAPETWAALRTALGPDAAAVDRLQLALQLGTLTRNHAPLVAQLSALTGSAAISSLRDLAKLDRNAWYGLLAGVGTPPDVPGVTPDEQRLNYAATLERTIEKAYPTAVLAARLAAGPEAAETRALVRFFAQSPDFEIARNDVDKYILANPGGIAGIDDTTALASSLKKWQRVAKVTPLVAERQALVAAGFTSAQSIARMAKGSFVTTYRETLGVERAQTIHANASQASAAASTLWARYSPQLNYPLIPSLGWLDGSVMAPALQQQGVDFTKLFGSLDSCACDDCRSIHGPAAYLVDLLQFIGGNGFSQLDARRPDLKLTELTCANTNTPMPYIDLANEVLENAVAPPGGTPSWPQTTWSAEELLAGPEHVNQGAYDTLKAAVYPWTLPFDLAEEEAEVYLAHLGVDRAELMETFASSSPSETTIAAVRLDLTSVDWKIITTAPSGSDPAAYWGPSGAPVVSSVDAFLQQAGLSYDELLDLLWTDFVNPGQKVTVTFNDTSCNLSNAQLWSSGSTAQPLQPADAFFARLHRFTRLRRKLGWTAFELDAAIRAFAPADLTEAFVVKLADLQALKRALGADLLDMLAWWGHLDTRARPDGAPSFYESIFQNKTAISQIDLAYFAIQALTGTGTQTLLTLASTIAAAIGVSADDLALLTDSVAADGIGLASPEIADTSLSLANLTGLYRVVSLARALKLTIRQLIVLRALTGIDPFDATDTKKARALLSALAVVKSSPFKLQELDELLRHVSPLQGSLLFTQDVAVVLLGELRAGLQHIVADYTLAADPAGVATRKALAAVVPAGQLDTMMAIIAGSSALTTSQAEQRSTVEAALTPVLGNDAVTAIEAVLFFAAPLPARYAAVLGPLLAHLGGPPPALDPAGTATRAALVSVLLSATSTKIEALMAIIAGSSALTTSQAEQRSTIEAALTPVLGADAVAEIESVLFGPPLPARYAALLDPLLAYLGTTLSQKYVVQKLSTALKLDASVVDVLLQQAILSPRVPLDPGRTAMTELLDPGLVGAPAITRTDPAFDVLFRTLLLVSKAALLVKRFKLTPDELTFTMNGHAQPFIVDWLDLNALPLEPMASGEPRFVEWQRARGVFRFRDRFAVKGAGVFALLEVAAESPPVPADFDAKVSELTGWSTADLANVRGAAMLDLTYPADFKSGEVLGRLSSCFDSLNRLGISAAQATRWASTWALLPEDAAAARNAAKAKYDHDGWLAVARPLRDVLRQKQRAALVAYLIGDQGYPDANALFDYFLIDVEMCGCMLTSRLKQAIGSTQLFVQRALMSLEPGVTLTSDQGKQWSWMGRYRLWEANRKVFLYPENWLDPTLRDDKTPFFRDLENELNQGAVTADSAEKAFRHYLEKLDAVARLQVVAIYDDEDEQTVHVVARTAGQSPQWFYRTYVGAPCAYWTPWEAVPLEIVGDHVVIVVWNRRVHVLWAIFTETAVHSRPASMPDPRDGSVGFPDTQLEVQLAYSEYHNGKWAPRRVTVTNVIVMTPNVISAEPDKELHTLLTELIDNGRGSEDLAVLIRTNAMGHINDESGLQLLDYYQGIRFPGCGGEGIVMSPEKMPHATGPANLQASAGWYGGAAGSPLELSTPEKQNVDVLDKTPSSFQIALPVQSREGPDDRPFFFQDERRVFFGRGRDESLRWWTADEVRADVTTGVSPYVVGMSAALALPAAAGGSQALALADVYRAPRQAITASASQFAEVYVGNPGSPQTRPRFSLATFYHPYVSDCLARLNRFGIDGLLSWRVQEEATPKPLLPVQLLNEDDKVNTGAYDFKTTYAPVNVDAPYPKEVFDFESDGAYSQYNWEIFFHAPFMIATRLSQNQRFAEAQRWFHYIFDPTDVPPSGLDAAKFARLGYDSLAHVWKVKKFFDDARTTPIPASVADLVALLAAGGTGPQGDALQAQVAAYRETPFDPFAIARLRTVAFQKATVMKYIDNLIAWGDQLFRQNTLESINEATLMYVLAAEILGPRPRVITPPVAALTPETYASLSTLGLGDLSDPLVTLENYVPTGVTNYAPSTDAALQLLYFCVQGNDQLFQYWDTVADRLFKIRHCMNIEGVVQQLPLFEPPIDPGLLVRAAAAGLDLQSVLSDMGASLPAYRFQAMAQKATELVGEVRALGQALLGAMEKRDAEAVSLLRANQELNVLQNVLDVKTKAVDEANDAHEALIASKVIAKQRQTYYDGLLKVPVSVKEVLNLAKLGSARDAEKDAAVSDLLAGVLAAAPSASVGVAGFGGSPSVSLSMGGEALSARARFHSALKRGEAAQATYEANSAGTSASHERREQDWTFQRDLAVSDQGQIEHQRLAAEIRFAIATKDLENHQAQIDNAGEMRDTLRDKYTNEKLYDWMVGQLSATYFQCYQLAYDLAKRAERGYHHELRDDASNATTFIQFGYWDSLNQGLLAGERLYYDLKRMEASYLDKNRREYEITKHVSLADLDPVALTQLRENGICFVDLPEALFDGDYPGHYLRRLKTVAVTIPCVVGPYTSVNCTLTLVKHSIRVAPDLTTQVAANLGAIESIVTSTGQSDGGTFELNLRDERYLPFEGAGVVGLWRIEMPRDTNRFDLGTVTDVVLHLRYTARDGGALLRDKARSTLSLEGAPVEPQFPAAPAAPPPPPPVLFSAKRDFADELYRFLHPDASSDGQALALDLSDARFPYHDSTKTISVTSLRVFIRVRGGPTAADDAKEIQSVTASITDADGTEQLSSQSFANVAQVVGLPTASFGGVSTGQWRLLVAEKNIPPSVRIMVDGHARLDPAKIDDVGVLCAYTLMS